MNTAEQTAGVVAGVDTHKATHTVVVVNAVGGPATRTHHSRDP